MSLYIGKINNQWVHTYSRKLRDKYLGKDFVLVYTLGTGKSGGTKVRGSISISYWIKKYEKVEWFEHELAVLESGRPLI